MSIEQLNAFLTAALDDESLRSRLCQEGQDCDRLQHMVELGHAAGFDFSPEEVVGLVAPGQSPIQGELAIFHLAGKLRLIWYPKDGEELAVEFGRPNDYADIFNSTAETSDVLTEWEGVLAIGFLAMVVDGERAPEEMRVLDEFLNQIQLDHSMNQEVRRKIQRIYHQDGAGALFNAAKRVLTRAEADQAFTLATNIVLADNQLLDEENDCLMALARALDVSEEVFREAIAQAVHRRTEVIDTTPPPMPLLDSVKAFFREENWMVQSMGDGSLLGTTYQGNNGTWKVLAQIWQSHQQVAFYSICPIYIPPESRLAIAEFITRANHRLVLGNFDLDLEQGEVSFKTSVPVPQEDLSTALVRQLVFANVITMDEHLPSFSAVLAGTAPPAAIAQLTGE